MVVCRCFVNHGSFPCLEPLLLACYMLICVCPLPNQPHWFIPHCSFTTIWWVFFRAEQNFLILKNSHEITKPKDDVYLIVLLSQYCRCFPGNRKISCYQKILREWYICPWSTFFAMLLSKISCLQKNLQNYLFFSLITSITSTSQWFVPHCSFTTILWVL